MKRWELERAVRVALFLATACLYVATAGPSAYWLDSGELAGAGATLGIPHAPGHPLYVILAYAASLLPFGPMAFRIALLSGLAAAWAVTLVYDTARLAASASRGEDGPPSRSTVAACAAAALIFGVSEALWLQAVRAEVYTLHLVLVLLITRAALKWFLAPSPRPRRQLLLVALCAGLGLTNHHFLLLLHLPAMAVLLLMSGRDGRREVLRALPAMVAIGAAALALYTLLPLRAAADPPFNFGDPETLGRFFDVVSARQFQGSVGAASAQLGENLANAGGMFLAALGPVLLCAAPVGLLLLILRRHRALALALALALLANLASKLTMDLDPHNPDAAGYFQTGMALAAVLAALALAEGLARRLAAIRLVSAGAIALALVLAATALPERAERCDLSGQRSAAAFDALVTGAMLPDAVVMPSHYSLYFNRVYHGAVEGFRPDLVTMQQGLQQRVDGGRPHAETVKRRDARLAPMLDAFVASGDWPVAEVHELARSWPVYLEPTLTLGRLVGPQALDYAGGYLRVRPTSARPTAQRRDQETLLRVIGEQLDSSLEGRRTVLLLWLQLAVVELQQGAGESTLAALALADRLAPGNRYGRCLAPLADGLAQARRGRDRRSLGALYGLAANTDYSGLFTRTCPLDHARIDAIVGR